LESEYVIVCNVKMVSVNGEVAPERRSFSFVVIVTDAPANSPVRVSDAISVSVLAATDWTVYVPSFEALPDTVILQPAVKPSAIKLPDTRVIVSGLTLLNAISVCGPVFASLPVVLYRNRSVLICPVPVEILE